jgi:hypothetical protein
MVIRFAASASRHGISHERVRHVLSHCMCPLHGLDPADDDLVGYLGPDSNGVPLEVFGIELDNDDVLVIHAMELRARYRDDYARVMECQYG